MRCVIILNALVLLYILGTATAKATNETSVSAGKSTSPDKVSYPKKVTSLKKPKKSKTPTMAPTTTSATKKAVTTKTKSKRTEADVGVGVGVLTDTTFKNLPADDLEFIKELDKQFKLHGGKVKIKVERDNSTNSKLDSKNSKRTIEGDLGYGYAENGGYEYNPPKFMFYPYSQQDIPQATESSYYETANYESAKTSVTIEPSYSYELKPQTSYEVNHEAQPQIDLPQPTGATSNEQHEQPAVLEQPQQVVDPSQQQHGNYDEPVIVLRIPGPTKYASHLQMLLQQYLEIRAAQYLRILEEADERKQHQQLIEAEAPQQYEEAPQDQAEEQHYTQDVTYAHQIAQTPAPVNYPAIDDVYQSYKGRHQHQQQQQQHSYQTSAAEQYYAPQQQTTYQDVPQYYYMPQQQYAEEDVNAAYQPHLYLIAMTPQQPQAIYGNPHQQQQQQQHQTQPIYVPDETGHESAHESSGGAPDLPITENNPRSTHTKVVFTQQHNDEAVESDGGGGGADYTHNSYTLPSIRPYDRHQSASAAATYQTQHYQQAVAESNDAVEYQQQQQQQQHSDTVAITQRPYNYHAHPSATGELRHGSAKRAASANPDAKSGSTTTNGEAEHRLQQIREYVREKLGAEMGSAVEYKTTQVLDG